MIEKQRRLLQPATEGADTIARDLEQKNETRIQQNNFKEDTRFENICKIKSDVNVPQHNPLEIETYSRTFQPIFKGNTEDLESKCLLEYAKCYLETKELWEKFHRLGTEMIITKTGR